MKLIEALENAITLLESLGYKDGGDIHDDFALAITRLKTKFPKASEEEL